MIGKKTQARLVYANVISTSTKKSIDIVANRFDFTKDSTVIIGTGKVYGQTLDPETGDKYEFWSEKADYRGADKMIILTGTPPPFVQQMNGDLKRTIRGNTITYHLDTKVFLADGQSEAVFIDNKK